MIRHHFEFRETIATILAEEDEHVTVACEALLAARQEVERECMRSPEFRTSLVPCCAELPGVVTEKMVSAAEHAGVGPMAAVAGAIAEAGVKAIMDAGGTYGVIDNGGDIALFSDRKITIGIHAGESAMSDRFAFTVPPSKEIIGICTSSATVGPSISFGVADAVIVYADNPALADAWATAICNEIRTDDQSLIKRLDESHIFGVMAVIGDWVYRWGKLPPITNARVERKKITRGGLDTVIDSHL